MTSNVLSGAKIILVSSDEIIRSEAIATMAIEGWEINSEAPESHQDLAALLDQDCDSCIFAILERDVQKLDSFLRVLRTKEISDSQIVLGYPSGSLVHRAYMRSGIEGTPFNVDVTPTGLKIDIASLPTALQSVWHRWHSLQLEKELKEFMNSASVSLLKEVVGVDTSTLKERTHLAYSIANRINSSMSFRRRVIRLSLFCDIVKTPNWSNILDEARHLWLIKDLLQKRQELVVQGLESSISWPNNTPIEIAIVETAILFQKRASGNLDTFVTLIEKCTSQLPMTTRLNLRQSVSACFARAGRASNERKSAA